MGDIIYCGQLNYRGREEKFGIRADDRRRHMYIIGKTGMGKTALLQNMAVQDVMNGSGIGIVDPHGEFAEAMLRYIPKERIDDVVYLNPADSDFPVGLNLLEDIGFDKRHLVASSLMGVFKKIWVDVWSPRMEYLLVNAILALLEYPDATLLDVNRLLTNKGFRAHVMEYVKDDMVREFWTDQFSNWGERLAGEATAAVENKIGQFVAAPLIRNIIGQKDSTINLREIMDGKKIVILNLSKGRIGEENSRLLGAMTIIKLYLAAMSRIDVPEDERQDFVLYVDEFQNFASEAFEGILSEARKYRLSLILAHQYIAQMDEEVTDAVFGNIGTLMTFRVGAADAEYLEKEFAPTFFIEDLVNISKYHMTIKLMIDGVTSRPFSAKTLPPIPPPEQSFVAEIIRRSRERYGMPREEIEKAIRSGTVKMQELTGSAGGKGRGNSRGGSQGGGNRQKASGDSGAAQSHAGSDGTALYDAICDECGKPTKIVFEPDGSRPVFCKKCRRKRERGAMTPVPAEAAVKDVKEESQVGESVSLNDATQKFSAPPAEEPPRQRPAPQPKTTRKGAVDLEGLRGLLSDISEESNEKSP